MKINTCQKNREIKYHIIKENNTQIEGLRE